MALTPGAQIGPYEIQSASGPGGTGEAYTARDTRLERTVAIEVLPRHWVSRPGLREKFEADAKVVAGLQHPNIRVLHDIGHERPQPAAGAATEEADEGEIDFLVLEHLEGETVADRLAKAASAKRKQAFSVTDAMAIAMQIADALDKAHQKGVIHRGLTPASVFLTPGAAKSAPPIAKLLDLGLLEPVLTGSAAADAAVVGIAAGAAPAQSVLVTEGQATAQSAIVATVDYLAPEQIEGRPADGRTDLFALGVVLYEMLTGKKAFEGKSRAVLMAAIMTAEPDPLLAAQPLAPPALDHVLKRCLAKDPDDRWQTAHDLLIQLRWIAGSGAAVVAGALQRKQDRILRLAVGAAVVLVAALATPLAMYLRWSAPTEAFQFRTPAIGLSNAEIAVSPDGRLLAFVAQPNQQQPATVFVRPVGVLASRRLAGTDGATQLFWSPDSRFIGYVSGGRLKKVEAVGGPSQEITSVQDFAGGTWNEAGTIVFGSSKGLFSVSAEGGQAVSITKLGKDETGHFWPHFLPAGRHYVYQAWSKGATGRALFVGALESGERTKLMAAETNASYAEPGYLVYHREATVFAQPFDADTRTFTGDAAQIAGEVGYDSATGRGAFSVSRGEVLVYLQGEGGGAGGQTGRARTAAQMQLGWVSRTGQLLGGAGDAAAQGDFDVSPDGRLVAVTRSEGTGSDVWIIDWQRAGNATRLTLDAGDDLDPVWSSDGTRVAFTSYRKGNGDIYVKNANGVGPETPLLESPENEKVEAWSPDGRYIAYLSYSDNVADIYALPQFGDRKPFPVVQGRYQKDEPQFSFDGKWLAYTSDESGTFEVYVVSFPAADQKQKISRDGGGQVRWSADGRELFFRALDNRIMVVKLDLGQGIEPSVPSLVTQPQVSNVMTRDAGRHQLSVSPDGQRFLIRVPVGSVQATGAGGGGGTSQAATVFDPTTGQAGGRGNPNFNAGQGGGRGQAGGAGGLTVIRHWPALADVQKP